MNALSRKESRKASRMMGGFLGFDGVTGAGSNWGLIGKPMQPPPHWGAGRKASRKNRKNSRKASRKNRKNSRK